MTGFRPWQRDCFELFFNGIHCFLSAPPGQGKSRAAMAHATMWVERGKKVLIATPRRLILQSFSGPATWEWDQQGKAGSPEATPHSYPGPSRGQSVDNELTLREFLEHEVDLHQPIFVGTHSGVLAALKGIAERGIRTDNLVVIIDEIHKVSEVNELGKVLQGLITSKVPTLLMTGTPFRGDGKPILSSELMDLYKDHTYHRDYATCLDESEHLGGFTCKVLVGDITLTLDHVLSKVKEENRYVVIKLPFVNSQHNQRLAHSQGLDPNVADLKAVAERVVIKACERHGLSYLSIVEDGEDRENFELLLDTTRDVPAYGNEPARLGTPDKLPRVVISQDTITEGVDCPWWTDSVMLGVTSSCVATIQFGQRCGRDHRSKNQRCVTSWSLVPDYWEPDVSPSKVREFVMRIIKTKLWLNFVGKPVKAPTLNTEGSNAPPAHSTTPTTHQLPPSPNAVSDNDLDVMTNHLLDGHTHPEGRAVLGKMTNGPTVTVFGPDGQQVHVLGDGNHIPKLDLVTMSDEQVLPVLMDLLYGVERTMLKGDARESSQVFQRYADTWDMVKGLWDNGMRDLTDISLRVKDWPRERIEQHLIEHGMLPKKRAKVPRNRGQKSD